VTHPPAETLIAAAQPEIEVSTSTAAMSEDCDELVPENDESNIQMEFRNRALRLLLIPNREGREV